MDSRIKSKQLSGVHIGFFNKCKLILHLDKLNRLSELTSVLLMELLYILVILYLKQVCDIICLKITDSVKQLEWVKLRLM